MSRDISTFWKDRIHQVLPNVRVLRYPKYAKRIGHNGYIHVTIGHFQMVAKLTRNAKKASGVRVRAKTNLKRLMFARRILRSMDVDYANGYRSLVIGELSFAQFLQLAVQLNFA